MPKSKARVKPKEHVPYLYDQKEVTGEVTFDSKKYFSKKTRRAYYHLFIEGIQIRFFEGNPSHYFNDKDYVTVYYSQTPDSEICYYKDVIFHNEQVEDDYEDEDTYEEVSV